MEFKMTRKKKYKKCFKTLFIHSSNRLDAVFAVQLVLERATARSQVLLRDAHPAGLAVHHARVGVRNAVGAARWQHVVRAQGTHPVFLGRHLDR